MSRRVHTDTPQQKSGTHNNMQPLWEAAEDTVKTEPEETPYQTVQPSEEAPQKNAEEEEDSEEPILMETRNGSREIELENMDPDEDSTVELLKEDSYEQGKGP